MNQPLNITDAQELLNASQYPKVYYAKHMEPGVCKYIKPDNSEEVVYLSGETLLKMAPSFVGKPVVIGHQKIVLSKIKEQAAGFVTDSFYNPNDGWMWVKFILIDDDAHDTIEGGYSVSNAYVPTEKARGGDWHNVPYHSEIKDGFFTHLALVPDPRYGDACIFTPDAYKLYQDGRRERLNELLNSKDPNKTTEGKKMFKLFNKTETTQIDADTEIELQNGKTAKVSDMVAALEAKAAEEEKLNSLKTATIKINGKDVPLSEAVEMYNAMCADEKKNADEKDEKENESDEEKENEADEGDEEKDEKANSEEEEKKNSMAADAKAKADKAAKEKAEGKKHFEELKNANQKAAPVRTIENTVSGVQRGAKQYGSVH